MATTKEEPNDSINWPPILKIKIMLNKTQKYRYKKKCRVPKTNSA